MKQRHLIKFISVLLTLVLFTLAVPFAANAAEAADVMDEGAKTFRIATAEGLKRLSSECSAKGSGHCPEHRRQGGLGNNRPRQCLDAG